MPMLTKSSWSAAAGIDWMQDGVRQDALLDDQHVGGVLAEHVAGEHPGALGEEGGQADATGPG